MMPRAARPRDRRARSRAAGATAAVGLPGIVRPEQQRAAGVLVADPARGRAASRRRAAPAPRAGPRAPRPSRRSGTRSPGRARCRATGRAGAGGAAATRRAPWCRRTRCTSVGVDLDAEAGAAIQRRGRARAASAVPIVGGYDVAPGAAASSAASATSGIGSTGLPIEQSTTPPGTASASRRSASSRSCGYGGGTKPACVAPASPMGRDYPAVGAVAVDTVDRGDELHEPSDDRVGQPGPDPRPGLLVHLDEHLAVAVQRRRARRRGRTAPAARRSASSARSRSPSRASSSGTPSPVAAETTTASGCARQQVARASRGSAVSVFVNTSCSGTPSASISPSTAAHRLDPAVDVVVGGVDEVHDEVGVRDLLQRRAERLDQLVREAADEADRVGEEHRLAAREPQPARARDRASRTGGPRPAPSASVSRLSSVDFPAFVYPTSATVDERAPVAATCAASRGCGRAARGRARAS